MTRIVLYEHGASNQAYLTPMEMRPRRALRRLAIARLIVIIMDIHLSLGMYPKVYISHTQNIHL